MPIGIGAGVLAALGGGEWLNGFPNFFFGIRQGYALRFVRKGCLLEEEFGRRKMILPSGLEC
jgi:hypothetical protein